MMTAAIAGIVRLRSTSIVDPGTTDLWVVIRSIGNQHVIASMNVTGREITDDSIDAACHPVATILPI
jgi:hypothetical protein